MSDTDVSYVAVAVFPPPKLRRSLSEYGADLSKQYGSWWTPDYRKFPPHITLWLAHVPNRNIKKLIDKAELTLHEFGINNVLINIIGERVTADGHVSYLVEKNNDLVDIHATLLQKLNRFRNGFIPDKYKQKFNDYPAEMQQNIEVYGARFVDNLFEPHITLTVIPKEHVSHVTESLKNFRAQFRPTKIHVFRESESGKSIEVLRIITRK